MEFLAVLVALLVAITVADRLMRPLEERLVGRHEDTEHLKSQVRGEDAPLERLDAKAEMELRRSTAGWGGLRARV